MVDLMETMIPFWAQRLVATSDVLTMLLLLDETGISFICTKNVQKWRQTGLNTKEFQFN